MRALAPGSQVPFFAYREVKGWQEGRRRREMITMRIDWDPDRRPSIRPMRELLTPRAHYWRGFPDFAFGAFAGRRDRGPRGRPEKAARARRALIARRAREISAGYGGLYTDVLDPLRPGPARAGRARMEKRP